MSSPLQTNIANLQELLEQVNNLPEASVELPELNNPAEVTEVFSGAEYIDETGAKKTGTFTIDSELTAQDNLIYQIQAALESKAGGSGVELPELSNPAEQSEVFSGAEYIDETGVKKTGTFTLANELSRQDSLIAQIQTALQSKFTVNNYNN